MIIDAGDSDCSLVALLQCAQPFDYTTGKINDASAASGKQLCNYSTCSSVDLTFVRNTQA
jgi:hypothetical protein